MSDTTYNKVMKVLEKFYPKIIKIHSVLSSHSNTYSLLDYEQFEGALYKCYVIDETTVRKSHV